MGLTFCVLLLLSIISVDGLVQVSAGHGCPKGWSSCTRYCISQRFFSGLCVRALCCCLPMIFSADHLERTNQDLKEQLKRFNAF